ncbi:DUF192 domain-containing protein [Halopseudomonas pertucinogena]|uniref:DUF192 domain-containing protein n=1 Tax=Halopseudomonas pertucinogena TaxID=86175 RepID=A0ABQ2CQZ4_9GAMM|nr:DUF192 domain-containing protein [Halopseudomonas pertucinogena]GGJ03613.1 hypothetical protein GCM10009083_20470 [Halopseudomonas pertucinogena]
MMWRWISAVMLVLLCSSVSAQERIQARLGGHGFELELVREPEDRRKGLMGREQLAPDTGMLFDFPAGTTPSIWMRNMHIPLDLLFVDGLGTLVDVFTEVPPCTGQPCEIYQASQPLRFVIEVPAGTVQRLGLAPGDRIDLSGYQLRPAPPL